MIQVILGDKGTGKTKRLIDLVNESLKNEHGDIIFIDDDKRYMYDLRHEIRFVDASDYMMGRKCSASELLGFVCGMLSVNFDISFIAIDAFLKLTAHDDFFGESMESFFRRLEMVSEKHNCKFLISISASEEDVPEFVRGYVI